MIDSTIAEAARPYLHPGERIVWTGRPATGLRFTPYDIFLVPFSLIWTGGVLFVGVGGAWATLTGQGGPGLALPFLLVPLVMLALGLYLTFGRFIVDARIRAATAYALTDRRALLVRRWFGERTAARPLDGQVRVVRRRDGSGSLEFGAANPLRAFGVGAMMWTPTLGDFVAFEGIPDVMAVYALARPPGSG